MKRALVQIPPRTGWCASCVEEHADLRLAASEHGRLCWLCPSCRTDLGQLAQYRDFQVGGALTILGRPITRSRRTVGRQA